MFPDATLESLCSIETYCFPSVEPFYLELTGFLNDYFRVPGVEITLAGPDAHGKSLLVWSVINEAWWLYGRVNPEVPVRWLALSKKLVQLNAIPENILPYCKEIIDSFDLQLYQDRYCLPLNEFEALRRDLPVVQIMLKEFSRPDLLPRIPEFQWEEHDFVPPI